MKTLFSNQIKLAFAAMLLAGALVAQQPVVDGINYQAVALDENRQEIAGHDIYGTVFYDKEIVVRFSIMRDRPDGTVVYSETHTTLTDAYGLFSLTIGHGQPVVGKFSDIRWGEAPHFLKVELDYKRNGDFLLMGVQQLMAVPYAMHALSAQTTIAAEKDPLFTASPASNITDAGSGKVITVQERALIRKSDSLTYRLEQGLREESSERMVGDRQVYQKLQADSSLFAGSLRAEVIARQRAHDSLRSMVDRHLQADRDTSNTNELQQLTVTGTSQPRIALSQNGGTITFKAGGATMLSRDGDTVVIHSTDMNTTYTAGNGLQLTGHTFSVKVRGSSLQVDTAGLAVRPGGIGTTEIADNAVTSAKIVDGSIGTSDLADGSVTTPKIADNAVTTAKITDGAITTAKLVDNAVTTVKIADNAVTSAKIVDGSITDADISNTASITDSKLATISSAGKVANSATSATAANSANTIVLRDASGDFSAGTITANLVGNVTGNLTGTASAIADNAVTSAKIVDGSIATADLADGSVTTPKIADNSVTTAKLADGAITTTKLADNTVTSAKIVDGTITDADISATAAISGTKVNPSFGAQNITTTGNVSAANLTTMGNATLGDAATDRISFNGQLTGANPLVFQGATDNAFATTLGVADPTANRTITLPNASGTVALTSNASGMITGAEIVDGSIGTADLADGSVTTPKIADNAVTTTKLADNAVTTVKIADNAVTTAKLADNTVTSAKIVDGSIVDADISATAAIAGTKVTPNFGAQNISTTGSVSAASLTTTGNATLGDAATDRITFNGQLTGASPLVFQGATDNAFATTLGVADPTANRTITLPNASGTVALTSNASGMITGAEIVDGSIATADLTDGSVTTPKIADNAVTTAKIADGAITTAKLADNAVTSAKIVDGTIVDADISATAAISGTKVNPSFGAQNISTTGNVSAANLTTTGNATLGDAAADSVTVKGILRVDGNLLPPRYTTAQRDAIASPTAGSVIYNTTTRCINYYNGIRWVELKEQPTGTLVYSDTPINPELTGAGYVCIGRIQQAVNPVAGTTTESWVATSTVGAPSARYRTIAIWTGTEMIVWGGRNLSSSFNDGGRYNPTTDSWQSLSTINAPSARSGHSAIWTGTEMIIWGGSQSGTFYGDGGRYNPASDSWTIISNVNAPSPRHRHSCVWTGNEMIVWGGTNGSYLGDGGKYNVNLDSWQTITSVNAPSARTDHAAIWTGKEMIVWGGTSTIRLNSGGRYTPTTDSWVGLSTTNAPSGRVYFSCIWTGTEMIIWGGLASVATNTGGRYNPMTDTWTSTSTVNAPSVRYEHSAVWTGYEMIVWGGSGINGGIYNPIDDTWKNITTSGAPIGYYRHAAIWTGEKMIIWGGETTLTNTGGIYTPAGYPLFSGATTNTYVYLFKKN